MANRKIYWTKMAIKQFEAAITYIATDSIANAEKVSTAILKELTRTSKNAEFFPPDRYKLNNNGTYRAFEKYHYRISYRFTDDSIRVLRVRHTGREPRTY